VVDAASGGMSLNLNARARMEMGNKNARNLISKDTRRGT
jgi:hypothetical protein